MLLTALTTLMQRPVVLHISLMLSADAPGRRRPGKARLGRPQPQFKPQRVHAVQVVAEQPFVAHKAQILVQPQRTLVGDLGLQYHLRRGKENCRSSGTGCELCYRTSTDAVPVWDRLYESFLTHNAECLRVRVDTLKLYSSLEEDQIIVSGDFKRTMTPAQCPLLDKLMHPRRDRNQLATSLNAAPPALDTVTRSTTATAR